MAIFVNTNVTSLHGRRNLNNVQNSLSTTYNRLSSGLRINSAKDDAAGLQIADRLTTQINGLNQGNRNTSDGIALAQTIEGGLDEITNMFQRARTIAVQAANGTNTQEDRDALTNELTAISEEINRIASQTKFGGKTILEGNTENSIYSNAATAANNGGDDPGAISFQVGANTGDKIELSVGRFSLSGIIEDSGITPHDFGGDPDNNPATTPSGIVTDDGTTDPPSPFRMTVSSQAQAEALITSIDTMLKQVDSQRGELGAIQNRLESTIRNQSNVSANQADARSRIRDTDFAEESANLTQQNIIQQAASSMLMQANMRPQLALSLLG